MLTLESERYTANFVQSERLYNAVCKTNDSRSAWFAFRQKTKKKKQKKNNKKKKQKKKKKTQVPTEAQTILVQLQVYKECIECLIRAYTIENKG